MSRDMWSPRQYLAYASHRARPFFELLARVDADAPAHVVDLGCGPGERTADLAARWPGAVIDGIDSSEQMILQARRMLAERPMAPGDTGTAPAPARVRFAVADLAEWTPDRPMDVIFSNAALQWVPEHRRLLPRWVAALAPGGWLAFSMPGNFEGPSHTLLRELCESPRWGDRLGAVNRHNVVGDPIEYLELLSDLGCRVDAWETTYLQVLRGEDAVLQWMRGTGLRPVLSALEDDDERAAFEAEYGELLRRAYPRRPFGTVLPYRRIFVVARQTSQGRG
jgi:trans-aconitate 2-methyltransferase